ncbi:MAG: ABC transporter permease [Bryobacterales bacterium]|nr:ABC transporter permease [Bryobacterales bacterium]
MLQTLWAHKLRTVLTMFGITWGIISITLMVGAGEGLKVGQERVAASFGKDLMIVFGGMHQHAGRRHASRTFDPLQSGTTIRRSHRSARTSRTSCRSLGGTQRRYPSL